jgi:CheY-like chemotaxis protein
VDAAEQNKQYVLVIDSDDEALFQTCMLLRRFGHTIIATRSGEKALEYMIVSPPAAIVADPSSGVALFLSRLGQDSRFYDVPLILLSWWPNASLEEVKRMGGFFAYLRKPINVVQLYRTVEMAVEKSPRQNIRIMTQVMVTLEDGLAGGDGHATTLSEHGFFFRTFLPRQIGARIPAIVWIKDALIRLEAVVLYVIPFDEGPFQEPGMGMKFVNISRSNRELIAAFIIDELENTARNAGLK